MPQQVLMIDDDSETTAALSTLLRAAGVAVTILTQPDAALATFAWLHPDLLLLNARFADGLTLTLLSAIHRSHPATVVLIRGRGDEQARIRALAAGADDYLGMPVSAQEIAARIAALLRRLAAEVPLPVPMPLTVGPLTLNETARTVTLSDVGVTLTATEFRLLAHLMAHPDVVQSFAVLLREVWDYPHTAVSDVVRSTVYRLRQKLQDDPAHPRFIHTVPGIGFILRGIPAVPDDVVGAGESE